MKYYEDITTMHGDEAEAVDVIIGGSPCQDLSVAGQRAGLDGERSSLFLDQIRVIKEAHSKYGRNKPRYMVWENVPGALSSAGGEDFRRVLEETAKAADETAVIPRPEKGKWTTAGCIMGDGWSIAWRILNAQFWGVPQRRRRIALVADFGGQSAPEILFKSESVSGYTAESGEAWERVAGSAESGVGITNRGVFTGTVSETLRAESHSALPTVCTSEPIGFIYRQGSKAGSVGDAVGLSPTLRAEMLPAICIQGNCIDRADLGGGSEMLAVSHNTVRRLTPLECERLQGYPDGWTDIGEWVDSKGKKHTTTDSARYKALGNSIALPPWRFVCRRICKQYGTQPSMGSLFDGIGGFPLIWRELNGNNSVPWACEIDEYCRAVTQRRLP